MTLETPSSNIYSNMDLKILTEVAILKEQVVNTNNLVKDMHDGYKKQWERVDNHNDRITNVTNDVKGLLADVPKQEIAIQAHAIAIARIDTKFNVYGSMLLLLGPLFGGGVAALVTHWLNIK